MHLDNLHIFHFHFNLEKNECLKKSINQLNKIESEASKNL
jgi:hypothetical protein